MLSISCKYALRAVLYLMTRSKEGIRLGIRAVADEIGANEHTTGKILQTLAREGIIQSAKGPNGGFYMDPKHPVFLIDIVRIIDGLDFFFACGLGLNECSETRPCPIHHTFKITRQKLYREFCTVSIQDLAGNLARGKAYLR